MIGRLNDLLIVCTAAGWPGRRTGPPEQGQEVAEKRALLPRKDSWPRVALRVGCSAQARLIETENGAELPVFPFEVQDPIQRSKVEALPQRISSHSARPQQPLWSGGGAGTVSGGEPLGLSSDRELQRNCKGRAGLFRRPFSAPGSARPAPSPPGPRRSPRAGARAGSSAEVGGPQ